MTQTVSHVAVFKDGKILMARRRDNNRWTTTGGHLEAGEDPMTGAIREAKEEAGINLDPKWMTHLATENITKPDGKKLVVHGFVAKIPPGTPTTIKDDPDKEVYRWHWLALDTLVSREVWQHLHVPPERNVVIKGLGLYTGQKFADRLQRLLIRQNRHPMQKTAGLIAPKHPDSWYPKDQLAKGMKVEREHSPDPAIRENISKNHIDEDDKYYNDPLFKSDLEKKAMKQFWTGFEKRALHDSRGKEDLVAGATGIIPLGTTLHTIMRKGPDAGIEWLARVGLGTIGAIVGGGAASALGGQGVGGAGALAGSALGNIVGSRLVHADKYDEHGKLKPEYA